MRKAVEVAGARIQRHKAPQGKSIERFIHGGLLVLNEDAAIQEAARAMHERGFGCAVVCDNKGRMAGMVTDRDLCAQAVAFGLSPSLPVKELMSEGLHSISEGESLDDATQIMQKHGVRRVPILRKLPSGQEKCVGMVTLDDLIAAKATDAATLARIVAKQVLGKSPFLPPGKSRHAEHIHQTLNRFHRVVQAHTQLEPAIAERLSFYVLGAIFRRISANEARQWAAQLPSLLREDLLTLKAGPDRSITHGEILKALESRFGLVPEDAKLILRRLWRAIIEFMGSPGECDQVLSQMPPKMRELFS